MKFDCNRQGIIFLLLVKIFVQVESLLVKSIETHSQSSAIWDAFANIAEKYSSTCLWTIIERENDSIEGFQTFIPYVIFKETDILKWEGWSEFISRPFFTPTCILFLMSFLPSLDLVHKLKDFRKQTSQLFFIVAAENELTARNFFSLPTLEFEENIAVLVPKSNSEWIIITRKIFTPEGQPEISITNKWRTNLGFGSEEDIFPEQMFNFYGFELRGSTNDFMPFTNYDVVPGTTILKPKPSLDVFMLDAISSQLNFTYELRLPDDGQWGFIGPDGMFVGVVGDVQKSIANFSLVLSIAVERKAVIDFSDAYSMDPLTFIISKNRPLPEWRKLITPFQGTVWMVVLVVMVISSFLYVGLQWWTGETKKLEMSEGILRMFASFLNQNMAASPKNIYVMIFLGIWFMYSLVVTLYYKTSLMSVLVVPSTPPTIQNLEQLLKSDLEYGMNINKGVEYGLFSTSTVELYSSLFKKMSFYSTEESMLRVSEGSYAYIYFKSNLVDMMASNYLGISSSSQLYLAREEFFPSNYAWGFPKGSPLRRPFNRMITRCFEAGLHQYWMGDLQRRNKQNRGSEQPKQIQQTNTQEEEEDSNQIVLTLEHLQGAYMVLGLGLAAGLVAFMSEYFVFKMKYGF